MPSVKFAHHPEIVQKNLQKQKNCNQISCQNLVKFLFGDFSVISVEYNLGLVSQLLRRFGETYVL
jgi:hypothetical protein